MFSKKCLVPVGNRLRILKVHMQDTPLLQPARSAAMPGSIFLGAAVSRHQWVHDWALELRIPGQGWFNMIQYDMMDWSILKQFNRSSEHAWCPQFSAHVCVCVCEFQASKWGVNEPERHFDLINLLRKFQYRAWRWWWCFFCFFCFWSSLYFSQRGKIRRHHPVLPLIAGTVPDHPSSPVVGWCFPSNGTQQGPSPRPADEGPSTGWDTKATEAQTQSETNNAGHSSPFSLSVRTSTGVSVDPNQNWKEYIK